MSSLLPGNIVFGGAMANNETENYRSLGHFVWERIKSFGDKVLIIDAMTGQEYTAKTMYQSIQRLAHVLQHLGIKSGDVICVSSENRYEYAITLFTCIGLNVSVAPINFTYTDNEVHHALNLSKPKIVIASPITIELVAETAKYNRFIKHLIVYGSDSPSSEIYAFNDLMENEEFSSKSEISPAAAIVKEDVALIVCSSGTTGLPKGVELTQYNIIDILAYKMQPKGYTMQEMVILSVLPWFHVFGCVTLIMAIIDGSTIVYLPYFEPEVFLGVIEKYRVKMAFMVPPLMVFLAKHPIVDKYDLSSLIYLLCGAAPLSKETIDLIKKRIPGVDLWQGYGLSESTLIILAQNDEMCKPGSVGALRKGLYAKVLDPDTGKILGPNERGELCFKGDCIMKGYVGDVSATQTALKDGWLHTGDIGYFDDDFEFFIVDRLKELIKYKGFQVPPAELEALLLTNPKIKDAAVIGKPDERAGELPLAFVVKQPNVELTEKEVRKFVDNRVSSSKHLRGGVIFIDEIPKNPSGKILRRVLRDMVKDDRKSKL